MNSVDPKALVALLKGVLERQNETHALHIDPEVIGILARETAQVLICEYTITSGATNDPV